MLEAIRSFDPVIALFIFLAYIFIDALYALYTLDVAQYNEFRAATTGAIIHFCIAFGVISYTKNWLYVFPLPAGPWIGTFYIVRLKRLLKDGKKCIKTRKIY